MKHSPRYLFPYRTKLPLSNANPPWVTLLFPRGLHSPPEIYVFADTEEETAEVREFVEKVLNRE